MRAYGPQRDGLFAATGNFIQNGRFCKGDGSLAATQRVAETVDRWLGEHPDRVQFLKGDLREAMLDLKQALIEDRMSDGVRYSYEVAFVLRELRLQGDEVD